MVLSPSVVVASFPVDVQCFDSAEAAGPVPLFFSEEPEYTSRLLQDSPEYKYSTSNNDETGFKHNPKVTKFIAFKSYCTHIA